MPVFDLDQIQGDVVPGFRRKEHTIFEEVYVFLKIVDVDSAKRWLGDLVARITWASVVGASQQGGAVKPYVNVAFTSSGLVKLRPVLAGEMHDAAFREGLAARSHDHRLFGDPAGWEIGTVEQEIDLVLNVASPNHSLAPESWTSLLDESVELVDDVTGATLPGGVEHFGFKDGLSQPAVDELAPSHLATTMGIGGGAVYADVDLPQYRLAPTADQRQNSDVDAFARSSTPISASRPTVPASLFVVDDTSAERIGSPFWTNGSFMVWAQLRQDVAAFRRVCRQVAATLSSAWDGTVSSDDAAALLMGRRFDGTPLAPAPQNDPNDFSYLAPVAGAPDVSGARCPLGAHARKMNPRMVQGVRHMILRRGIPYGQPLSAPGEEEEDDGGGGADGGRGRGLLFVCYQSDIENQFETLQGEWANSTAAPEPFAVVDCISSDTSRTGTSNEIAHPNGGVSVPIAIKNDWVVPAGGLYLFVPSRSALGELAG